MTETLFSMYSKSNLSNTLVNTLNISKISNSCIFQIADRPTCPISLILVNLKWKLLFFDNFNQNIIKQIFV